MPLPKRKRLTRNQRLQSAKEWINKFSGKHIVKSYSKWYGVDKFCAITELRINGVNISKEYEKQLRKNLESIRLKKGKIVENCKLIQVYSDPCFEYIAGNTSNGVPYGIKKTEHDSKPIENLNLF